MGNSISSYSSFQEGGNTKDLKDQNITLMDSLDFIATYYILTMDFKSLLQLQDKQYCEELISLTSNIIDKYFNDLEVKQIAQRIQNNEKLNDETKEIYCTKIAKFYIKVAHIFSAIVTTINPEYTYKDVNGNKIKTTLLQKSSIPENTDVTVSNINLCSKRIKSLQSKSNILNEKLTIHPDTDICSINMDNNLDNEPGINELKDLYYDDEYDYKSGKFLGMSPDTKKIFKEDLKKFYLIFTGNTEVPVNINKFSDIKLKDYSKEGFCNSDKFTKVTGNYNDKLFELYANNLKNMTERVNKKQEELLIIINKIFIYVIDPITKKNIIRIHTELNEDELQNIVDETRKLIIELYLNCETDFVEGVKIYEAIVEGKIFNITQNHIKTLEKEREKLISPYITPRYSIVNSNHYQDG